MKKVVIFSIILLFPLSVYAHPGKTDYRGGHKCRKSCAEWELQYGEYHLHDKDWKPIRLDAKGIPIKPIEPELQEPQQDLPAAPPERTEVKVFTEEKVHEVPRTDKKVINEYTRIVTVYEEGILPLNLIFLLILALAMLIILLFIKRKRKRDETTRNRD